MRRRSAVAVLLHAESFSMVDDWIDHIELRRDRYGKFTVRANKFGENPDTGKRCWGRWLRTSNLKGPISIRAELDTLAESLGVELDWQQVVPTIASIDWLTAAVIADRAKLSIPALPAIDELLQQRALRPLGSVTIGVEWGYDMHHVEMPFERWARVLTGEPWGVDQPYQYEGDDFTSFWRFDGRGSLEVTYDDGGVGWQSQLSNVDQLIGSQIDGVDLGKLALTAASSAQ